MIRLVNVWKHYNGVAGRVEIVCQFYNLLPAIADWQASRLPAAEAVRYK